MNPENAQVPDYFALLDLPEVYHLDAAQVRAQFLRLSRQFHPDFHTQADSATQAKMLADSALLNKAYKALLKPDDRLTYLLQRYGYLGPDGGNLTDIQPSKSFLMEMMELNELADEWESADATAKMSFENELKTRLADSDAQIAKCMLHFDNQEFGVSDNRAAALKPALQAYLERKYLLRLQQKLNTFASPHHARVAE